MEAANSPFQFTNQAHEQKIQKHYESSVTQTARATKPVTPHRLRVRQLQSITKHFEAMLRRNLV